jgi:hypothetical protein
MVQSLTPNSTQRSALGCLFFILIVLIFLSPFVGLFLLSGQFSAGLKGKLFTAACPFNLDKQAIYGHIFIQGMWIRENLRRRIQ